MLIRGATFLPVLFASAVAGQLGVSLKNVVSENVQISLGYDHNLVYNKYHSISPASQVFYTDDVFVALLPNYCQPY